MKPAARDLARRHYPDLLAWLVLLGIAALLYVQSQERWGDPIIDLGRELYLPQRLLDGSLLYRDIIYNYGPLAPYLLALVVRLWGDSLAVFQLFGLGTGVAALAALYAAGRLLAGRGVAFFAALFFLVFSFFACSPYGCKNFVLPYAYAATLSTVFALWSFTLLLRYLYQGKQAAAWWGSVLLLLLTLVTKTEYGAAIAAVHLLAWWQHRIPWQKTLPVITAAVLIGLGLYRLFSSPAAAGHHLVSESLARFFANPGAGIFFSSMAGFDSLTTNLLAALAAGAKLALLATTALAGATLLKAGSRRRGPMLPVAIGLGILFVLMTWWWADYSLFAAVPLLAVLAGCYAWRSGRRDPLLLLAVLVVVAAGRILLNYSPTWYGFYLAVPAYLFLSYLLGSRLSAYVPAGRIAALLMALVALTVMSRYEWRNWHANRAMTQPLVTAKGRMFDFPTGRSEAIAGFLQYLQQSGAAGSTLVVFPEGVTLNYFSGTTNPLAYYNFIPPEIGTPEEEARILGELRATRPRFIAMASRDLEEFGSQGFGIDYALEITSWIQQNYLPLKTFGGAAPGEWGLTLLTLARQSVPER